MAVSKLLGHASVATTQRYLDHLAIAELRDAVPALPAAARKQPLFGAVPVGASPGLEL
ncbi:MAG: hypothetical protein V3V06_07625 [Dehalococcoidia bacterium]